MQITERSYPIKLRYHTVASFGFSLAFYLIFKNLLGAVICFLAGILIDLDHFFDYIRDKGWNLNLKHFFNYHYRATYERAYFFLHAYELLLLLGFIVVVSNYNILIIATGIGFAQHLILDHIFNPVKPMAYFLIYRFKNGFSKQCLLKDDYISSLLEE